MASSVDSTSRALLQGETTKRNSHIFSPENGEEVLDENGKPTGKWTCNRCEPGTFKPFALSTTKNAINHLETQHGIDRKGGAIVGWKSKTQGQRTLQHFQFSTTKGKQTVRFDWKVLKAKLVRWIVRNNIPFSVVEQKDFRSLLFYLAHTKPSIYELNKHIPRSANTIKAWIINLFDNMQQTIKQSIRHACTEIHLSFDSTTRNYLGIVGHWLDVKGEPKAALLGFKRLEGAHSGLNQADIVWEIITQFELQNVLGFCTLGDNAKNKDTAMEAIGQRLQEIGVFYDAESRRLRCFGHVINRSVQAFMWGVDSEAFTSEIHNLEGLAEEVAAIKKWRSKGPLGKLHNVLVHIRRTSQSRARFLEKLTHFCPTLKPLVPTIGVVTRWGRDYDSLCQALEMRPAIDSYILSSMPGTRHQQSAAASSQPRQSNMRTTGKGRSGRGGRGGRGGVSTSTRQQIESLDSDILSNEDWEILEAIKEILKPMKKWTLKLQGKHSNGYIAEVVPAMDAMLARYERAMEEYKDHEFLSTMIKNGWKKLNDYYTKIDETPAYYLGIALHPQMKLKYLEWAWATKPTWVADARRSAETVWISSYKSQINLEEMSQTHQHQGVESITSDSDEEDPDDWQVKARKRARLDLELEAQGTEVEVKLDEFESFQKERPESVVKGVDFNVVDYWFQRLQTAQDGSEGKQLAKLALNVQIIPTMSTQVERVFSSSGLLITDLRCQLDDRVIEAVELIKSWEKEGFSLEIEGTKISLDEFDNLLRELIDQNEVEAEAAQGESDRGDENTEN